MKPALVISRLFSVAFLLLFLFFLAWRWQLGLVRYFDSDEFAHLHWSYHIFRGDRPYTDFMYHITPGFLYVLSIVFYFFQGVTPFIAARIISFLTFVLLALASWLCYWQLRRSWIAIAVPVILASLPIPSDKFLEIRPEILGTLLLVIAIFFQVNLIHNKKTRPALLSGIFYTLSFLVTQKTLPFLFIAVFILAIQFFLEKRRFTKAIFGFLAGTAFVLVPFLLRVLTLGDVGLVAYSILKLPFELHQPGMSSQFQGMQRLFYFFPNPTYYGRQGISPGLVFNHAIWFSAILVAAIRLITLRSVKNREEKIAEVLILSMFLTSILLYLFYLPFPYMQYLVPTSIFVAFFFCDFIRFLWVRLNPKPAGLLVFSLFLSLGLYLTVSAFIATNEAKFNLTNEFDLSRAQWVFNNIPKEEFVLDLEGLTLYYPDPYYVCCEVFGTFAPFLTRPLPSLSEALIKTRTKYIYVGTHPGVDTLPLAPRNFILENYQRSPDGLLYISKNW